MLSNHEMNTLILLYLTNCLVVIVLVLFSVMFITLLERKLLGLSQLRLGPNKWGWMGLLQPLMDGIKFLFKELIMNYMINRGLFFLAPCFLMLMMLLNWMVLLVFVFFMNFKLSVLFFLAISGISVFSLLFSSWASNNKFGLLGCTRGMAQSLSYEIVMSLIVFSFMILMGTLSFYSNLKYSTTVITLLIWPFMLLWLVVVLAESNRAPFDFIEGESELVSGYNIEFSASLFTILFIGEYGVLLFFSLLTMLLFFNSTMLSMSVALVMVLLLIRSVFPRFRYDKLMYFTWFKLLPISIIMFLLMFLLTYF